MNQEQYERQTAAIDKRMFQISMDESLTDEEVNKAKVQADREYARLTAEFLGLDAEQTDPVMRFKY